MDKWRSCSRCRYGEECDLDENNVCEHWREVGRYDVEPFIDEDILFMKEGNGREEEVEPDFDLERVSKGGVEK